MTVLMSTEPAVALVEDVLVCLQHVVISVTTVLGSLKPDQVNNFMFTAVNCGSQESNASTLTVPQYPGDLSCHIPSKILTK